MIHDINITIKYHWFDVSCDDFVQILKLLVTNAQFLAQRELVIFLLLQYFFMRQDVILLIDLHTTFYRMRNGYIG